MTARIPRSSRRSTMHRGCPCRAECSANGRISDPRIVAIEPSSIAERPQSIVANYRFARRTYPSGFATAQPRRLSARLRRAEPAALSAARHTPNTKERAMILICCDGSPDSKAAIQRGAELLRRRCPARPRGGAGRRTSRLLAGHHHGGGDPMEADRIDASAILMGSRGLTGFKSVLLGSVSHGVIQHADRTVIVVPSPAGGCGSRAQTRGRRRRITLTTARLGSSPRVIAARHGCPRLLRPARCAHCV